MTAGFARFIVALPSEPCRSSRARQSVAETMHGGNIGSGQVFQQRHDFGEDLEPAGFRQAQRDVGGLGVVGLVRLISTRGRTVFVGSDMFGLDSPECSGQLLPAQEEFFTNGKERASFNSF
jgi:hypothetical protein